MIFYCAINNQFNLEHSLITAAVNKTDESSARSPRHLLIAFDNAPRIVKYAGGEGYTCITSRGILGSCRSYRTCYPFFKYPEPAVRYPVLNVWDSWVLGNHDTCSYYTEDGREAQGVCCTNPITPTPGDQVNSDSGSEQNKVEQPTPQQINFPNFPGVISSHWPPQIPTHPPDHAAPTHPPGIQNNPGVTTSTKRPTTMTSWPTRFPSATTTRRNPIASITTESIINDISFDGGSCGAKNGFQDQNRIVGGTSADPNEWPWAAVRRISNKNCT